MTNAEEIRNTAEQWKVSMGKSVDGIHLLVNAQIQTTLVLSEIAAQLAEANEFRESQRVELANLTTQLVQLNENMEKNWGVPR